MMFLIEPFDWRKSPDQGSVALEVNGVEACQSCIEDDVDTFSVRRFGNRRTLDFDDVVANNFGGQFNSVAGFLNRFTLKSII